MQEDRRPEIKRGDLRETEIVLHSFAINTNNHLCVLCERLKGHGGVLERIDCLRCKKGGKNK